MSKRKDKITSLIGGFWSHALLHDIIRWIYMQFSTQIMNLFLFNCEFCPASSSVNCMHLNWKSQTLCDLAMWWTDVHLSFPLSVGKIQYWRFKVKSVKKTQQSYLAATNYIACVWSVLHVKESVVKLDNWSHECYQCMSMFACESDSCSGVLIWILQRSYITDY